MNRDLIVVFLSKIALILFLVKEKDKTHYRPFRGRFRGFRKILRQISMFLYAIRYQSWFLPKIRCKCLRFFCRKSTKTYGKTNTFGGIWYARQIFSVIIIFLKTLFLGKTEDAIIFQHIPARDIVSHSNCRFGKRRQRICLIGPRYLKLFSNARIKLKIPDEGLSRLFNLRARSVASIRYSGG